MAKKLESMSKSELAAYAETNFELELDTEELSKDEMIEAIEEAEADADVDTDSEQEDADEDPAPTPEVKAEPEGTEAEYSKVFLKTVDGSRRNFTFKDRFGRDWSVVSGDKGWTAIGPDGTVAAPLRKTVVRGIAASIAQYAIDHPVKSADEPADE